MASEIAIIKVPAPIVTLQQFVALEGVFERTAYRWMTGDNGTSYSAVWRSFRAHLRLAVPTYTQRPLSQFLGSKALLTSRNGLLPK